MKIRKTLPPAVLCLALLCAGLGFAFGQEAEWSSWGSEILRTQISDAKSQGRSDRKKACATLREISIAAEEARDKLAWAEAQLALAELGWAALEEGKLPETDPLPVVEELLEKCHEWRLPLIEIDALHLYAQLLDAAQDDLAALAALDRAVSLAFAENLADRAVELLVESARGYRNLGHTARVRQAWSLIDLALLERGVSLSAATRGFVQRARQTLSTQQALAATPEPAGPPAAGVSFQPLQAGVLVATGGAEHGRTRLMLFNHSTLPAEGTLTISTNASEIATWEAHALGHVVSLRPSLEPQTQTRKIRLLPGQQLKLYLAHVGQANTPLEDTVTLVWRDASSEQSSATTFHFHPDAARQTAVINGNHLRHNAAFPLPIYHEIFFRGTAAGPENFLAIASEPSRLEFYNEDTGELLAIDAEGDGVFTGANDYLPESSDHDGDERPDLLLGPKTPVGSLEIFVFPRTLKARTTLSLRLADFTTQPPSWREDAPDTIE